MAWLGEELPEKEQDGRTPFSPRCLKDVWRSGCSPMRDLLTRLDLVFMDTTSIYFEGAGGQSLGQPGYSKDHRPDLRQMLDGDGRPVDTGYSEECQPVASRGDRFDPGTRKPPWPKGLRHPMGAGHRGRVAGPPGAFEVALSVENGPGVAAVALHHGAGLVGDDSDRAEIVGVKVAGGDGAAGEHAHAQHGAAGADIVVPLRGAGREQLP
jgi:hypothetical protein